MRSIMVPLDGSAFSVQALRVAEELARRSGAEVHLVHVRLLLPQHPLEKDEAAAELVDADLEILEGLAAGLRDSIVQPVRLEIIDPDWPANVTEELQAYVEKQQIELVVMTTHGRSGFSRAWVGSVAESFLRRTGTPVLLIRPGTRRRPAKPLVRRLRHILIPLDGSRWAEEAIEPAIELGQRFEARYTLVRIVPRLGPAPFGALADWPEREQAEAYLDTLLERLRARGLAVTARVVQADSVAPSILAFADEYGVDLVALATHGRTGVPRLIFGSVADKLIRGADRPLLIVNPTNRLIVEEPAVDALLASV